MTFSSQRRNEVLLTLPSLTWLTVLFLVPSVAILAMAFKPADPYGGVGRGWTLETWRGLGNPNYPTIAWRTVWLSLLTTVFCLLLGVPTGYAMAHALSRWKRILLLLVVIPLWTNFLIRIFAWKILLHPEGIVRKILLGIRVIDQGTMLMYNEEAVLLVLVYTYLPFAILPIYAAAEKFDFSLMEAARDLGCRKSQAFVLVFLPGISRGLLTAALVVFIPALGSYLIPDIMGGPAGEMIGNKIAQRVFVDRHLPHASALSALLTLAVVIPMAVIIARQQIGLRRRNASQ